MIKQTNISRNNSFLEIVPSSKSPNISCGNPIIPLSCRLPNLLLETNDSQIIHERLEYILTKNKGVYFDITPEQITISPKIFLEKSAYQEIKLKSPNISCGNPIIPLS